MVFTDSFSGLTVREQKALVKSWAKIFANEIFSVIKKRRFSVLDVHAVGSINKEFDIDI